MKRSNQQAGLGGRQLEYNAVLPRFLQALGKEKVEDALSKESGRKRMSEEQRRLPDQEDEGEEAPLIIADESEKRELARQEAERKKQQDALAEARADQEELRARAAVHTMSKLATTEETTHVFRSKKSGASLITATAHREDDDDEAAAVEPERKRPRMELKPPFIDAADEADLSAVDVKPAQPKRQADEEAKKPKRRRMTIEFEEKAEADGVKAANGDS